MKTIYTMKVPLSFTKSIFTAELNFTELIYTINI